MPPPAGFTLETEVKPPIVNDVKLPEGFRLENEVVPSIRQAPPKGILDRVKQFFTDEDKLIARASNIYALAEVTGLPISEVNKEYDNLRYSGKVTGFSPEPRDEQILQLVLLPGIVYGAVVAPIATAGGLIAFGALDKAIPTDKLVSKMEEEGIADPAIQLVEAADFIGKSLIAGKVFKKTGSLKDNFFKQKITEYKLPEKVTLAPEQVRDIYQTGELTTAEEKSMWASLDLNSWDRRAALDHGVTVEIPAEKIVRVVDNPLWAKVKNMFGVPKSEEIVAKTTFGEAKKAPAGAIEAVPVTEKQRSNEEIVSNFVSVLKEAKILREKQETIYSEERAKKFAKLQTARATAKGEAGYFKELGALKGEMQKVEFEAIREKIGQEDIDALFQSIRETPKIGEWEKINAMHGLSKILGEEGGTVPTEGEITLLNAVFGEEFTKTIMDKRSLFQKFKNAFNEIANIPRSLMASFDLSAPFRQGIFLIGRQKQFGPAFKKMFGAFAKQEAYNAIQDAIITHPDYQLARESGLSLTDVDVIMGNREEQFMSSWAEKIPFLGKGIKASGRAYIGFLNKLRYDVFADLVNKADQLGLEPRKNRDLTKAISDYINNASGRGTLPNGLKRSAVTLNSVFFSPRLMFSRLNLLNPITYIKQPPFVRKEALKDLFSFFGVGVTVLTLAQLSGAEVGDEPRSPDFGKIRIGNTRVDVWGGFQQLVRIATQLVTGKYINSATGKEMTLGEGYRPLTRADIVQRFLEGKLAPVPSFVMSLLKQKEPATGKPISVSKEIVQRFTPMIMQDMYDIAKEDPRLLPLNILELFGVGVQTYSERKRKGF